MSAATGSPALFQRLPTHVIPTHYRITLHPDLQLLTFSGSEIVSLSVQQDTDTITLNAAQLTIQSCSFREDQGSEEMAASGITMRETEEQLILSFPSIIRAGTSGKLSLSFTGKLSDKLKGFYRAAYPNSVNQYAAVTHFEPTGARFAFPGWDEPAIKSTFQISLIGPKHLTCLSNMPAIAERVVSDWEKEVTFDVTPLMSTYLVAFVVGDYDFVEDRTQDEHNILVRVYAPPDKKEQGRFALDIARRSLQFYAQYFQSAYQLPEVDLIALSDFPIGAMENWGLITYRENALLVDEANTSAIRKQYIALVVAHELSHMWFGNLVTMTWWTDLWLKEGFAVFIEYMCVHELLPGYSVWEQFVSNDYMQALELDALHNTHAIEVPVNDPAEISEIFDAISYDKGSSIIRMLHRFLGEEDFRKGLALYLKRHSYGNTETEDLWQALAETSGKPVSDVMSSWTKQKGFPVVTVSQRQEGSRRVIRVAQEMFTADGRLTDDEKGQKWMIPLTVIQQFAIDAPIDYLLTERTGEIVIPDTPPGAWVKVNQDAVGFYRVAYSKEMSELLVPAVSQKILPPLDRLSLQSDLFALVRAGKKTTIEFLQLLLAYVCEDNFSVWFSIFDCLSHLNALLAYADPDVYTQFLVWSRRLLGPLFQKMGWEAKAGEGHSESLLRTALLGRLSALNHTDVWAESKKRFHAHVKGEALIPADLRAVVYSSVARDADDDDFAALIQLYHKTDQHEEKSRISCSLGAVRQESLIKRVLDFSISSDVRSQDSVFVIGSVSASGKTGSELAWSFFQQNVQLFIDRYADTVLMGRLVKSLCENFAHNEKAAEVTAFFARNKVSGSERSVLQAVESIRQKAEWLQRDQDAIRPFFV